MRNAIIQEIHSYMKENDQIYFLTGDLGFNVVEQIEKDFPDRFVNVGVAEQNMIGIASGLALSGKKVFVYSIIPFLTMRCYEQLRDDVCYHNLDITLLGAGSGLSYGILSTTHFALEDLSILRPLPNLTIFSPADETEAVLGMKALKKVSTPVYIRIGKKKEPIIYPNVFPFELGKNVTLKSGKKIALFSTGSIMDEVLQAVAILKEKKHVEATVIDVHSIKPLDIEGIVSVANSHEFIVTIEEHGLIGGLGSAIVETLSDNRILMPVLRIGTSDTLIKEIGTQEYLRIKVGLDGRSIAEKILQAFF